MMMYAFGIGEIAISVSGVPTVADDTITHTIRSVGAVSRALHDAQPGTVIGMRGPFGTNWGLAEAAGRDLVIVAGGVGLAPLRPVVLGALAERDRYRQGDADRRRPLARRLPVRRGTCRTGRATAPSRCT